jgi:D-tyrosyl-tRNA(Tyr) deacylase|uniref:D-aminoacyl-tRNA deacylase n=1 Tax=candidate division WOR-3 bacterium TaxID=2052148 RepID=A0A7V3PSD2_UNCW3
MKALLQRVTHARVLIENERVGEIGTGLVVLLGIGKQDDEIKAQRLASKVARLRIFDDEAGKMNRALLDIRGAVLVVSQFTLYADTEHGLRPSFSNACEPERAEVLYHRFIDELRYIGVHVETGKFGARMAVELVNNGPVTIMLEE